MCDLIGYNDEWERKYKRPIRCCRDDDKCSRLSAELLFLECRAEAAAQLKMTTVVVLIKGTSLVRNLLRFGKFASNGLITIDRDGNPQLGDMIT